MREAKTNGAAHNGKSSAAVRMRSAQKNAKAKVASAAEGVAHDMDHVQATLSDAGAHFKQAATELYHAMGTGVGLSGDAASSALDQGKQQALALGERLQDEIKNRPLVYVGAAFAVGWLLSRFTR